MRLVAPTHPVNVNDQPDVGGYGNSPRGCWALEGGYCDDITIFPSLSVPY